MRPSSLSELTPMIFNMRFNSLRLGDLQFSYWVIIWVEVQLCKLPLKLKRGNVLSDLTWFLNIGKNNSFLLLYSEMVTKINLNWLIDCPFQGYLKCFNLKASEPKWVNPILDIIWVNSLRLGDLHLLPSRKLKVESNELFVINHKVKHHSF